MPANTQQPNSLATTTRRDRLRLLNATDTTRIAAITALSGLTEGTGTPAQSIQGSGSDLFIFQGEGVERELHLCGTGAADQYVRGQVIGYKDTEFTPAAGSGNTYTRRPICTFYGQFGSMMGTADGVGTGRRFVDRLTVDADFTPNASSVAITASGGMGTIRFDGRGHEWFGVELVVGTGGVPAGVTGTGGTSANGLWCAL